MSDKGNFINKEKITTKEIIDNALMRKQKLYKINFDKVEQAEDLLLILKAIIKGMNIWFQESQIPEELKKYCEEIDEVN